MSFTYIRFLFFLVGLLALYSFSPAGLRRYVLVLGSLVFCFVGSFWGGVAALCFTSVNFGLGGLIANTRKARLVLILGIVANVVSLYLFKLSGRPVIGLSFLVLTCIGYLVDVSRGEIEAESSLVRFAGFAAFFPKYGMGPLVHYSELAEQLDKPNLRVENLQEGLSSFVLGFVIKVLSADRLWKLWTTVSAVDPARLTFLLSWTSLFSFGLSLYLQWQSYSLMAVGLARLFGIQLPGNMNYPYLARGIRDFFRRWHTTFYRWMQDYVYQPLGGNRGGMPRTVINVVLVCLLAGLWHGAHWNYVVWALFIAGWMLFERYWLGKRLHRMRIVPHLYVLLVITLSWLLFAFHDFGAMGRFFVRLIPFMSKKAVNMTFKTTFLPYLPSFLAGILCLFPLPENLVRQLNRSWVVSVLLSALFFWAVYLLIMGGGTSFLYLNL